MFVVNSVGERSTEVPLFKLPTYEITTISSSPSKVLTLMSLELACLVPSMRKRPRKRMFLRRRVGVLVGGVELLRVRPNSEKPGRRLPPVALVNALENDMMNEVRGDPHVGGREEKARGET